MQLSLRLTLGLCVAVALSACSGPAADIPTLTVSISGMQYQPAALEVVAGRPVRLTVTNSDALEHDFSVAILPLDGEPKTDAHGGHVLPADAEPLALHLGLAANSSGSVTFTPSQAGAYEFYCTVAGHQAAGMVGALVVTAP